MYSLYRAWLSLGPCPMPTLSTPPTLNLTTPTSGGNGTPDVALQVGPGLTQFSAHRAVLSAHSGFFKAALINYTDSCPIAVPNVNVDEFSSLLTFMYTGYLDLNLSNIYNILLATHILHMPRALEICRSFLLQSQTTLEPRQAIIKPIPSRTTVLPTQQQFYAPTFSNLQKSEDTPFKTVVATATTEKVSSVVDSSKASTSKINVIENKTEEKQPVNNTTERKQEKNKTKKRVGDDKVIIDIACCDGPVRFHRVVNKNYGQQQPTATENLYQIQEVNRNAAMNKVMNENIRDQQLSDENQSQTSSELFTCVYCNHTFKSQYCYQKHARRHLNPVTLEAKTIPKENVKREVKLLDMNVQYYPCKTCGSKFPSYYFVHKHRKMCHAEEMANEKSGDLEKDSDSGSAIDVEAVNNEEG